MEKDFPGVLPPGLTLGRFQQIAVERLIRFRIAGSDGKVRSELEWWLEFLRTFPLGEEEEDGG